MKNTSTKILLLSSVLAFVCTVPLARAQETDEAKAKAEATAARKAEREKKHLEKYDANHNGAIDPEEQAVVDADKAKAKSEKAEKAKAKAEKKAQEAETK